MDGITCAELWFTIDVKIGDSAEESADFSRHVALQDINASAQSYLSSMAPYLECIRKGKFTEVPAPVCVQMQVSSRCSTHCRMCDHWREQRENEELNSGAWKDVFTDLGRFGVKTAIFSGGEPLVRSDIAELLRSARRAGLRIGLLTNGIVDKTEQETADVLEAIATCADWVTISVDGTEILDDKIRNLQLRVLPKTPHSRPDLVHAFCVGIQKRNPKLKLSATVTLQSDNILMDLNEACQFIKEKLTIPQVNFKFATGATTTLDTPPTREYRLGEEEISRFLTTLKQLHNEAPEEVRKALEELGENSDPVWF